jgi:protocatechuate 3,4-dioxygenase beta subunit
MMVLAGTSEGRVATDGAGRYAFTGLAPGSYAVRPTEPRCGFGPDVMNLNNLRADAVQDFRANCR